MAKGQTANRAQLAEIFGVALPTVDGWVRQGCPVAQRGSRGVEWKFDTAAVAKWRQDKAVTEATGEVHADAAEIERRTKTAKMLMEELALAKARGEVAPVKDFERVQAARAAVIRANVMNVPQRAVLQLLGCTDETEFKTKLRKELTAALEAAATESLDLPADDDQ